MGHLNHILQKIDSQHIVGSSSILQRSLQSESSPFSREVPFHLTQAEFDGWCSHGISGILHGFFHCWVFQQTFEIWTGHQLRNGPWGGMPGHLASETHQFPPPLETIVYSDSTYRWSKPDSGCWRTHKSWYIHMVDICWYCLMLKSPNISIYLHIWCWFPDDSSQWFSFVQPVGGSSNTGHRDPLRRWTSSSLQGLAMTLRFALANVKSWWKSWDLKWMVGYDGVTWWIVYDYIGLAIILVLLYDGLYRVRHENTMFYYCVE